MPPKNKGSSKQPAKVKTPTLIDGLTKEEMSKEQLEEHIVSLREELDREREERNYFQLERDRMHSFWENTERQLQELQAQRKNLYSDIEEDEWRHQVEIKVYKQKMKHLLCEHQNTICELEADGLVSTEERHKEQKQLETKLREEMRAIKIDTQQISNENLVKELELKHDEEMTKARISLEKKLAETEATYEKKMTLLRQELENLRKNETSEREDQWNSHIAGLTEDHDKALRDANELVNRMMHQVLDVSDSLKTQMKEMKTKQQEKEKDVITVLPDNKRLAELLLKLQLERDELYKTYSESIEKVQHKAGLKSVQLDTKLTALTDVLEKTHAQLHSVLSATNMDQTALAEVANKIQENLDSSNNSIKVLQYKKAQISKMNFSATLFKRYRLVTIGKQFNHSSVTLTSVQPPKNKGSSKKPAKESKPTDEPIEEEMSREQLEEQMASLEKELEREKKDRNYFQLESNRIQSFWETTERQLQEVRAGRENLYKDIEEDEWRRQVEIKVYKQKMKHLLCEHQNTMCELEADGLVSTEERHKEQKQLETKLREEMRAIKIDTQQISNENLVKELELKHDEEMTKARISLEKKLAETEATYEKKMTLLPQELENLRKNETSEREDQWNSHIAGLTEDHDKALRDANELVNRMMHQVLDVSDSLKTQMKEMKTKQQEKEKDVITVLPDNKRLAELLLKVEEEITGIEKKLKNNVKKKDVSEKLREKKPNDMRQDYEALKEKFNKLQLERDELYKTYSESIEKVQHKAGLKSVQLDTKLTALTDVLEKTHAQLHSVLSATNMDQTALAEVANKIQENLDSSNNSIKVLQYKKAQISKMRSSESEP
ncbi:putative growth arrest-specific protein 8-like [Scophthalmus maximus]|uniref:Dynein regulatory complex subunit 4 n=1 Tax=Scophthalmus maximus TaxID=52904 RepID=A0A2U9BCL0_SCOMX|nr:putative growth arrest-specific protein 8-like [Scophthalmus maximus]